MTETNRLGGPRPKPGVTAVIPTYNRPELMRLALRSVLDQDYRGPIEVLVVFDRSEPDVSLEALSVAERQVRVLPNTRTPGLAGSRNTGILAATYSLVAFLDDDDSWRIGKLTAQIGALSGSSDSDFVTTAMAVNYDGRSSVRLAGKTQVTRSDLTRSRMAMLHSSSFLIRRELFLGELGMVEESLPRSMSEDWDLLLRASRIKPILHVDEPWIDVRWGATSYFAQQWEVRNAAQMWLLEHHPELHDDPRGSSLLYGQLAFGHAVQKERREAVRWVGRSLSRNWKEPRAYIALGVASGLLPWRWVLRKLNERGHGI